MFKDEGKLKIFCPNCGKRTNYKLSTIQSCHGASVAVDCKNCNSKSNVTLIEVE